MATFRLFLCAGIFLVLIGPSCHKDHSSVEAAAAQSSIFYDPELMKAYVEEGRTSIEKDPAKADHALQAAAKILLSNPDADTSALRQVTSLLNTLGIVSDGRCHRSIAVNSFRTALSLANIMPGATIQEKATLTKSLGIALYNNKTWEESITILKEALPLNKAAYGEISADVGACYNHLAAWHESTGDYKEAIQCYQKQYDILHKLNGGPSKYDAYPLTGLASAYTAFGDYGKAAEFYEKSAGIGGEMGGYHHYHLVSASRSYLGAGDFDNALRTQVKAIELKKDAYGTENEMEIGVAYRQLGDIYIAKQRYSTGDSLFRKALHILQNCAGDKNLELARTYLSLASSAEARQNIADGLDNSQKALKFCTDQAKALPAKNISDAFIQQLKDPQLLAYILTVQGDLYVKKATQEALQRAVQAYKTALDCIAFRYNNLHEEESKTYLNEQAFPLYEKTIETALNLSTSDPEGPWLALAFSIVEKSKANLLLESVRESGAQQFAGVPNALTAEERRLRVQKLRIESDIEQQESYFGTTESNPVLQALQDSLFATDQALESLLERLAKTSPEYFRLKYDTSTFNLSKLKKSLPTPETLVLEYFWGDQYLFAFAIHSKKITWRKIRIEDSLQAHLSVIKSFVYSGSQKAEDKKAYLSSGYALYQLLIAPFIAETPAKEIVIIPDGELSRLPFQALLSKPVADLTRSYHKLPYLVKDYIISYSYSSSLLLQPLPVRKAEVPFGGFAPDYAAPRLLADSRGVAEKDLLPLTDRGHLRPLLYNKVEVENIAQAMKGQVFLDDEASERTFKNQASRFQVVHLAMHGLANDSIPGLAQLIFSETGDGAEDGRLYAYEVFGLSLNADLVVLSACQTGKGRLLRGEGILSLGRAFRFAGCPSIIMSYWNVNDAIALQLMEEFYRHLKETGNYAKALEQAKSEFIDNTDDERTAHPHFWATYSLIGGHFEPSNTLHRGWLVVGAMAVFIFFRALKKRKIQPLKSA